MNRVSPQLRECFESASAIVVGFSKLVTIVLLASLMPILLLGVLVAGLATTDRIISIDRYSTKRAPGCSDENFSKIKIGMTADQVKSIIGDPLRISERTSEWW